MKIHSTKIPGIALIETTSFCDLRGMFSRFFCSGELEDLLGNRYIVNVNFSRTKKVGTVRGMHFQYPPRAEMKFIRCIRGSVYDVVVDVRHESPTFLQWYGVTLSEENLLMVCVPEGFAHGFQTLKPDSEMLYLHTEFYSPEHECGLLYNDPVLNIMWPLKVTDISDRDKGYTLLNPSFMGVIL